MSIYLKIHYKAKEIKKGWYQNKKYLRNKQNKIQTQFLNLNNDGELIYQEETQDNPEWKEQPSEQILLNHSKSTHTNELNPPRTTTNLM